MNQCNICEIYDNELKKIIIRDQVIFEKSSPWCVSFDNKFFFNGENPRFKITRTTNKNLILYNSDIVNNYQLAPWISRKEKVSEIYRDFGIDELDKEVEPLVKALNTISGIQTVGSCCGHGKKELWVHMICKNIKALMELADIIAEPLFKSVFDVFVRSSNSKDIREPNVFIILKTRRGIRGDRAYKLARQLSQFIKQQNKMLQF